MYVYINIYDYDIIIRFKVHLDIDMDNCLIRNVHFWCQTRAFKMQCMTILEGGPITSALGWLGPTHLRRYSPIICLRYRLLDEKVELVV